MIESIPLGIVALAAITAVSSVSVVGFRRHTSLEGDLTKQVYRVLTIVSLLGLSLLTLVGAGRFSVVFGPVTVFGLNPIAIVTSVVLVLSILGALYQINKLI